MVIGVAMKFRRRSIEHELDRRTYDDETQALATVSEFVIDRACDIGEST